MRRVAAALLLALICAVAAPAASAQAGLPKAVAEVRGAIQWLHDNGLLVARVTHGALAATLTERGEWVASGRTSYPGVKKRNPMASVGDTTRLALDGLKD